MVDSLLTQLFRLGITGVETRSQASAAQPANLTEFSNLQGASAPDQYTGSSLFGAGEMTFEHEAGETESSYFSDRSQSDRSQNEAPANAGEPDTGVIILEGDINEAEGEIGSHAQQVASVLRQGTSNSAWWEELAPGADVSPDKSSGESEPEPIVESQDELNGMIDGLSTGALDMTSDKLVELTEQFPEERVINGSFGFTRVDIYKGVTDQLQKNPELAQELGLSASDLEDPEAVKAFAVGYVDNRMDQPNSAYNQSLQHYQDVTQWAADRGTTFVVSTGNEQDDLAEFPTASNGAGLNFLAQSDSVISVAASTDDDTSGAADFSSQGDGRYNPTLSADGTDISVKSDGETGTNDGTSFSAPQVSATVAEMLDANPNLTFDQIKAILQGTAHEGTDSVEAQGAGVLNTEAAIDAAQQQAAA